MRRLIVGLVWGSRNCFLSFFLTLFTLWPHHMTYGIFVPQPGIEPRPSAGRPWSHNHWMTREVPRNCFHTHTFFHETRLEILVCWISEVVGCFSSPTSLLQLCFKCCWKHKIDGCDVFEFWDLWAQWLPRYRRKWHCFSPCLTILWYHVLITECRNIELIFPAARAWEVIPLMFSQTYMKCCVN